MMRAVQGGRQVTATGLVRDIRAQNWIVFAAGVFALMGAFLLPNSAAYLPALTIGAALTVWVLARTLTQRIGQRGAMAAQLAAIQHDPLPCFLTTRDRHILAFNPAAAARFNPQMQQPMGPILGGLPLSTEPLLLRLQSRAQMQGGQSEQLRTTQMQVFVRQVGPNLFLWRTQDMAKSAESWGADLDVPLILEDHQGRIMQMNAAVTKSLGFVPQSLTDLLGAQEAAHGLTVEVAAQSGPIPAQLVVLDQGAGRLVALVPPMGRSDAPVLGSDFRTMPVALMMFDAEGRLCATNLAAQDVLGQDPGPDAMFHDLFEGLGRPVSDWLADVVAARIPAGSHVLRLHDPRNDAAFVQVTLRRMVDQGGPRALAILQDATALKTLEAQFVQSQKMEAIGQLAGGVAHDFNNLLTAISGHCDLLLTRFSSEDATYPDLIQISQNANRAAALVGQLLAFSRKQTLQPEFLEIQELVSDMTHLMNRLVGEKVRLSLYHGASIGTIRADRRQLEQVLMNLVVNARDAMDHRGTIKIETEAVHLTEDLKRDRASVPKGDYALIRVSDAGTGIAPEHLQKIFEPFYTTKKQGEGTGLGLSTAYGIVKQSGGFIFVDSILGKGSVFSLYFPIHARPAAAPVAPPKTSLLRQGEGVVLLVEDEAPVRAFAARALRLRGYTVLEAASGEDALDLVRDADLRMDLFVTDVIMPGLDGPTWVREGLALRPNTPVIFVSGYAEDVMAEQQSRIPNSTFLPKPFSLADLTAAVHGQLQRG